MSWRQQLDRLASRDCAEYLLDGVVIGTPSQLHSQLQPRPALDVPHSPVDLV